MTGSPAEASPRPADPILQRPPEGRVKVHEIFHSLQGESTHVGRRCVLIRLTGCQMRCTWCDTEYAFYEGAWRTVEDVVEEATSYDCPLVELTGGEPLLQPGAFPLMTELCDRGHEVLVETGGGVDVSRVDPRVRRILDVKCPDSGEAENNRWENLDVLTPRDEVKFVIASEADYQWARDVVRERRLAERCPILFSPVWDGVAPRDLAEWILQDRLPVRFQLQLHKLLWGPETRGV